MALPLDIYEFYFHKAAEAAQAGKGQKAIEILLLALKDTKGNKHREELLSSNFRIYFPSDRSKNILMKCPETRNFILDHNARLAKVQARSKMKRFPNNEIFSHNFQYLISDAASCVSIPQKLSASSRVVTFGSCFALNISKTLKELNVNCKTISQVEDFNNPLINAALLMHDYKLEEDKIWRVQGNSSETSSILFHDELALSRGEKLTYSQRFGELKASITNCDLTIITLGTALGMLDNDGRISLAPQTSNKTDNSTMLPLNTLIDSIKSIYSSIRKINQNCLIVFTVSPVPIYASWDRDESIYESDCVSKSLIRIACHEFFKDKVNDDKCVYYPSFEIVRWISPTIKKLDAWDDPRHPSFENMIKPIMSNFISTFFEESVSNI